MVTQIDCVLPPNINSYPQQVKNVTNSKTVKNRVIFTDNFHPYPTSPAINIFIKAINIIEGINHEKGRSCYKIIYQFLDKLYKQKLDQQMNNLVDNEPNNNQQTNAEETEVAGFVMKTFEILGVEQYQKIIYWSTNGLEFVIKDVVKFQQIVLPRYFRHKKMNSFVRQLNMYGFHKMKHNHFKSTFKHEYFQKDKQELLPLIRRKPKLNGKENEDSGDQAKQITPCKIEKTEKHMTLPIKQEEPTMAHQKWANLSHQFLETTRMINMSLIKVTINDLSEMVNQIPEEDDRVSIDGELQGEEEQNTNNFFEDPQLFFSSKLHL